MFVFLGEEKERDRERYDKFIQKSHKMVAFGKESPRREECLTTFTGYFSHSVNNTINKHISDCMPRWKVKNSCPKLPTSLVVKVPSSQWPEATECQPHHTAGCWRMDLVVCSLQRHGGHSRWETGVRQLQCPVPPTTRLRRPCPWLAVPGSPRKSTRRQGTICLAFRGAEYPVVCLSTYF